MGIPFRKRGNTGGTEHVRAAAFIDTLLVRLPPGACLHGHHAGMMRGVTSAGIRKCRARYEYARYPLRNAALLRILRVDPQLLLLRLN